MLLRFTMGLLTSGAILAAACGMRWATSDGATRSLTSTESSAVFGAASGCGMPVGIPGCIAPCPPVSTPVAFTAPGDWKFGTTTVDCTYINSTGGTVGCGMVRTVARCN